jgi:hypothetical protein
VFLAWPRTQRLLGGLCETWVLGEAFSEGYKLLCLCTINLEELNNDKFKGEIIGIGGGAIHANTIKQ